MRPLFFLSGLPRSGSTVLAAILNQNPSVFVTPTSPLLDVLNHVEGSWPSITQTSAWWDPRQKINVSRGIIDSIYAHIQRPVIIDKHRGWVRNVQALTMIYGLKPKILVTVRDIDEIVASFARLAEKARSEGQDNFIDQRLRQKGLDATPLNTAQVILENIGENIDHLLQALQTDRDCLHLVEYRDLMEQPESTVAAIYRFLGLPAFGHDFGRVEALIEEDDRHWGLPDLHKIRPELKRVSPPAVDVLGEEACSRLRALGIESHWRDNRV